MLSLPTLTDEAIAAKPYFEYFSPGPKNLLTGKVAKWVARAYITRGLIKMVKHVFIDGDKAIEDAAGDFIGDVIIRKTSGPAKKKTAKLHKHINHVSKTKDPFRKNGLGGRVWPMEGSGKSQQLIVVFHDANRAGPHIDVHIGRFSLVRRVKPEIYEQLTYNGDGWLTQESQELLLDFLRDEIDNRSRIPQNLDHTLSNARAQWVHKFDAESIHHEEIPQWVRSSIRDNLDELGDQRIAGRTLAERILGAEHIEPDDLRTLKKTMLDPATSEASYQLLGGEATAEWIQKYETGQLHHYEEDPWWSDKPVLQQFHNPEYGSGRVRQVLVDDKAVVYKAHTNPQDENGGGHFEFYAPAIDPNQGLYVHQLYSGGDTGAPIAVWGKLTHEPPAFLDRLHLRGHHPVDLDKMIEKSDMRTSTAKYDGSSCYVVMTKKGTTVWSPRKSVVTGRQIEYTYMLPELATLTTPDPDGQTVVMMGELLFREKPGPASKLLTPFRGHRNDYVPQAQGSGILNSHAIRPDDVVPEIRLYRYDKIGNTRYDDLPFWHNRALQWETIHHDPSGTLKVVEEMDPDEAYEAGFEGVVTAPNGESINEGFKLKWWQDPNDWQIDSVDLHDGPRGGIAGVVRFTSLESGRHYNLGPGQMGDHDFNRMLMENPDQFVGRVARVNSKQGHEGRASQFIGFHDDKGVGE